MLHTTPRRRLQDDLAAVEQIAARPATTAKELAANLTELYDATFAINFERYDVQTLVHSAPDIARTIFDMRLRLRDQVADWHARGFLTLAGQRALRNALRIARYATDMLGEINIRYAQLGPGEKTLRGFSGRNMNTLVNPAFETGSDLDFRSGDLLLMRGMHHNSAAIARIGDVDSQFSHLAIVHTDANGKHWVVEALIEEGLGDQSALLHADARPRTLRPFPSQGQGARRARRSADPRVGAALRREGRPAHLVRLHHGARGDKELFCSKLVRKAFGLATDQQTLLPTFSTRFDMKNRDFVERIGVTARETFAPADIELEPAFDLVAEWQDYRVTSRLRLQDLLMDRLFLWMEQYDYRFREDFPIKLIGYLGQLSGHLSTRAKNLIADVVPKVPPNMQRSTIQAVAMLHRTAEPLLAELQALERRSIDRTGRPLHAREVYDFLEGKRQASNGQIGYLVGKA